MTKVRVSRVAVDRRPGTERFDPGHPDANAKGYVEMPRVSVVHELPFVVHGPIEGKVRARCATRPEAAMSEMSESFKSTLS